MERLEAEFKEMRAWPEGELNRDTRYVIKFNVPPEGDFYDASMIEMPNTKNKIIAAKVISLRSIMD